MVVAMNTLDRDTQSRIIAALVEGNSIRATVRMTGAAKNTVVSLLERLGEACQRHHDSAVVNLPAYCKRFQCDEIHTFCYARKQNLPQHLRGVPGYGDVWTWTAICDSTRLMAAWHVGGHGAMDAAAVLHSLRARTPHRIQVTTDGNVPYMSGHLIADDGRIDMAMLKKVYKNPPANDSQRRYAPAQCIGVQVLRTRGNPDLTHASTSYAERSNLTMRMGMRRFTRLTNGHSKKLDNLKHAVALHMTYYNFCRVHQTLKVTPAMAAGLASQVWGLRDLLDLLASPALPRHDAPACPAPATRFA